MTKNAFVDYQRVRVALHETDSTVAGYEGAVLGMVQDEQGQWTYGVFFEHLGQMVILPEASLEATGEFGRRQDFYDDTKTIRVVVDPKTGEGRLK